MSSSAQSFFASIYGDRDPADVGVVSSWLRTSTGPRELIADPVNLRVKALGLGIDDLADPTVAGLFEGLSDDDVPYSKFTVYALPGDQRAWESHGFLKEGVIQGFFSDGIDAHVWAQYGEDGRDEAPRGTQHDRIVQLAANKDPATPAAPTGYTCAAATEADADAISALMTTTFSDYPSSLAPATIAEAIREESHRFRMLVDEAGTLAAVASAEIDRKRSAAEMTDCATRPDHRGRGLMSYLLWRLERDMVHDYGIRDLYTLARADEPGMNCAFAKLGYTFTGRLAGNCRMPNGWESMNIWCRRIDQVSGLDPALDF